MRVGCDKEIICRMGKRNEFWKVVKFLMNRRISIRGIEEVMINLRVLLCECETSMMTKITKESFNQRKNEKKRIVP